MRAGENRGWCIRRNRRERVGYRTWMRGRRADEPGWRGVVGLAVNFAVRELVSSVVVRAAPGAVMAVVLQVERWPEWYGMVSSVSVEPPGKVAVGSLVREEYSGVVSMLSGGSGESGMPSALDWVVTRDGPLVLAMETVYLGLYLEQRWEVEALADGRSRLRYMQCYRDVKPSQWLSLVAGWMAWWALRWWAVDRPLRRIRAELESGAS